MMPTNKLPRRTEGVIGMKRRNEMNEYSSEETRIYAPAESGDGINEGYPQITIYDTGWTENEREQMRIHGIDGIDMLKAGLS